MSNEKIEKGLPFHPVKKRAKVGIWPFSVKKHLGYVIYEKTSFKTFKS